MTTRKKKDIVLIEEKESGTSEKRRYYRTKKETPVEQIIEPVVAETPAEAPAEKPAQIIEPAIKKEPLVVDFSNLSYTSLKKVLIKVLNRLGANVSVQHNAFYLLSEVGRLVGLEPYKIGKGAEYTKDYLKRILEKANGK